MKEIQFRAWDGNTMYTQEMACFTFGKNNYWSCYMYNDLGGHFCCDSPNEEAVLMQSTGMFDKYGKLIFEGDVVNGCSFNGSYAYGKIVWDNHFCGFVVYGIGKFIEGCCDLNDSKFIEVVGNIYENENFLNKTNE